MTHDLFIKQFGLVFNNVFRRELGVSLRYQFRVKQFWCDPFGRDMKAQRTLYVGQIKNEAEFILFAQIHVSPDGSKVLSHFTM